MFHPRIEILAADLCSQDQPLSLWGAGLQEFMLSAVEVVRRKAAAALREIEAGLGQDNAEHTALLDLAAHLFAIGSELAIREALPRRKRGQAVAPEPTLESSSARSPRDRPLERHLAELAILDPPATFSDFYDLIVIALEAVEEALLPLDPADQDYLRLATPLTGLKACGVTGVIQHWIGRESGFLKLREALHTRAEEMEVHLPPRPNPRPTDGLAKLRLVWSPEGPGRSIVPLPHPHRNKGLLGEIGSKIEDLEHLRLALCPLPAAAHPLFRINAAGSGFQALHGNSLEGLETVADEIDLALSAAAEERVHLVVFPELMICEDLRTHVTQTLRGSGTRWPFGVSAGSFHLGGDDASSPPCPPVNEALLLDERGGPLADHQKCGRFVVTPVAVERALGWFPDRPPKLAEEIVEHIRYGTRIQLLDTELGLVALAICADLSTKDETCIKGLYESVRPDLLVIVSMSSDTKRFEEVIADLADWEIATLFVNAACICPPRQILAAANLALPQLPGSPPTRFRWRTGGKQRRPAEVRYFHPPQNVRKDHWVRATAAMGETGLRWLTRDGRTLGLVLDFGPLVRWTLKKAPGALVLTS